MRALALALALTLALPWAAAQEPLTGTIRLSRVAAGETVALGPNTTVEGDGPLVVYGRLLALGAEDGPVRFRVPVYVFAGNGTVIEHARFERLDGFSLLVTSEGVTVRHARFESGGADDVGVEIRPGRGRVADVDLADSTFTGYRRAVQIAGGASVSVTRAAFADNAVGVAAEIEAGGPLSLDVTGSTFTRAREAHVAIDVLGAPAAGAAVALTGNVFENATAPALLVTGRATTPVERPASVASNDNTYRANAVGIRATEAGDVATYRLSSTGDHFDANGVGAFVDGAAVVLDGARFRDSRDADVVAPREGRLELRNSTYASARLGPATPTAPSPAWALPVAALVALAAGGAGVWAVTRRRTPPAAAAPSPPPPLRDPELRILEAVVASPGRSQVDVARELGLSRQALHYHVKKLEAQGLVAKTPHGRETRLAPTSAGRARVTQGTPSK